MNFQQRTLAHAGLPRYYAHLNAAASLSHWINGLLPASLEFRTLFSNLLCYRQLNAIKISDILLPFLDILDTINSYQNTAYAYATAAFHGTARMVRFSRSRSRRYD